ncbi:MAG: hypothetical protein U0P45_10145 [Acidimicrobiales bacterium]
MSNRALLRREQVRRKVGSERPEIGDGELLVLIACNLVATVGLAGDIARHLEDPGNLGGDFLAGWHLVLYGGVLGVGAWLGVGAIRKGPSFLLSALTTTIGFCLLALGGMADAVWHARFGVEAEVEALVSPPHLMVFSGLVLLLTSPIVVLWRRPARRLGVVESVVALGSTVATVLVVSLFTGFLSPLASGMSLSAGYTEPLVGESPVDYDQVRGLGIAVFTTILLVAAFTLVLARFRPMPGLTGVAVFLCGAPALAITDAQAIRPLVLGYAMAGLVLEAMVALLGKPTLDRVGAAASGAAMSAMLWLATFALLAREDRLGWSTSMWTGTVVLAGLVGAATGAIVGRSDP